MSNAANLYPAPGAAPAIAGGQPLVGAHPSQAIAESAPQAIAGAQVSTIETSGGTATEAAAGIVGGTTQSAGTKTGKLAAFEGFLKKAGHIAGVVLTDILKYAIPVASLVAVADPEVAPAVVAFTASVKLVQAAVISVQQKWSAAGSEANGQKLADVLEIVEQPIVTMFAQSGTQVDRAYVTNLVNGVVAILNAQPGIVLPKA